MKKKISEPLKVVVVIGLIVIAFYIGYSYGSNSQTQASGQLDVAPLINQYRQSGTAYSVCLSDATRDFIEQSKNCLSGAWLLNNGYSGTNAYQNCMMDASTTNANRVYNVCGAQLPFSGPITPSSGPTTPSSGPSSGPTMPYSGPTMP